MKKRYYSLIVVIIVIVIIFFVIKKDSIAFSADALYKIDKVIDGDTFVTSLDGKEVTVRMKGVDTPETKDPRKPVQCFGKEASHKTKELLEGKLVRLISDKTDTSIFDKYGRALMYVYRDDGLFVNEYLLKEGYAHEYTYGNGSYEMQKAFKKLEKQAREEKMGLWGSLCSQK